MDAYSPHTEQYKGYTISIVNDDDASNPRDDRYRDNAATLITWERDYGSPDSNPFGQHDHDYEYDEDDGKGGWRHSIEDGSFMAFRWQRRRERHSKDDGLIVLALEREYDGSIRATDYDPDAFSGEYRGRWRPCGVAYMTIEQAREEYGTRTPAAELRRRAEQLIRAEVAEYSDWAIGNVWGYVIGDAKRDHIESCWGFIGDWEQDDYCLSAAREAVDGLIAHKAAAERDDEGTYADPADLALPDAAD